MKVMYVLGFKDNDAVRAIKTVVSKEGLSTLPRVGDSLGFPGSLPVAAVDMKAEAAFPHGKVTDVMREFGKDEAVVSVLMEKCTREEVVGLQRFYDFTLAED